MVRLALPMGVTAGLNTQLVLVDDRARVTFGLAGKLLQLDGIAVPGIGVTLGQILGLLVAQQATGVSTHLLSGNDFVCVQLANLDNESDSFTGSGSHDVSPAFACLPNLKTIVPD